MRGFFSLMTFLVVPWMVAPCRATDPTIPPTGPSFRVETELFEGTKVEPAARHLILFQSGVIYEFRLDDQRLVTIYDPGRGRVVLVDCRNLQRVTLATDVLTTAAAQFRAAVQEEGKGEAFGLSAEVQYLAPSAEEEQERLEVHFGDVKYSTTIQAVVDPAIPTAYHDFTLLASRLNIVRKQGIPPFARLALSEAIAQRNSLPLETSLEMKQGLRKQRIRSHLLVVEQLSANDEARIAEIGRVLASCAEVSFSEFQQ